MRRLPCRHVDAHGVGRRGGRTWRACRSTLRAAPRPSIAMTTATARSGQALCVADTPTAANITARLPIASLREHSHTERMLASPLRNA
jgi:hypothetical protein